MKKLTLENLELVQTDCLALLATLDDNSIDLIATDPPYFKVKAEAWDNQWKNKADFFTWLSAVLAECHRVLKPSGSLYLFAGPHLATEVEGVVSQHFDMLNHIVWRKPSGRHNGCCKETLRRFFPQTEHILFAESRKKQSIDFPFPYQPVLSYLEQSRIDAGVSRKVIDEVCNCQMSGHWFGRSQFHFPSEQHYNTMNGLFGGVLKPYAELKAEYVQLRDGFNSTWGVKINRARRTFNVSKDVHYTNVWDFKSVHPYQGKHPCEKPLDLMEHIIKVSSMPDDVVLDLFTGSGSTAIARLNTGRKFIGSEMGEAEFNMAVGRIGS